MGQRGPAPTPTRILELRGSNRAGRHAPTEPRAAVELLPPPEWLTDEAKRVYASLGARLVASGLLTGLDAETLACFSMAWADLRTCQEFLGKHGQVYLARARPGPGEKEGVPVGLRPYPHAKIARELRGELIRLGDRLGLSPAARARLFAEPTAAPADGADPLDTYFDSGEAVG